MSKKILNQNPNKEKFPNLAITPRLNWEYLKNY